jgi:hypothetical protein
MNWKEYENKVLDYFSSKFPDCKINQNIKLIGKLSNTPREIDILLTTTVFGCSMQLVIECKNWNSKLDVADIGSFIDKLKDIGIYKGIIISKLGYTDGAYKRARTEVYVQLQVLNFENIPEFYGFWAVPYKGKFGAALSAPNGWVINNKVPNKYRGKTLCFLHPMEYTTEEANRKKHLMYFQINFGCKLIDTLNYQDREVKKTYPKSVIEYWTENSSKRIITYRKIHYVEENYFEFTGAIEKEEFYVYCVCSVPNDYNSDDLARLNYVMNEIQLIKMENVDPTNSDDAWENLIKIKNKNNNNAI